MTVASVSAVTITLTLVGVFMAVIMNATKLAEDIEGNVDVSVFVDIGTNEKDMKNLVFFVEAQKRLLITKAN